MKNHSASVLRQFSAQVISRVARHNKNTVANRLSRLPLLARTWATLLLTCLISTAALAIEPVSTDRNGVAAGGHDVMAYRGLARDGDAIEGSAENTVTWKGADWRFVRPQDKAAFLANPEKFSPAFNGHCANALSLGEGLIPTSGRHWVILDDQLYFFYAQRGAIRWLDGNHATYLQQATEAWKEILDRQ